MALRTRHLVLSLLIVVLGLIAAGPASAAPQYRGVHLHSMWAENSNSDMDRELDLAKRAGANTVRLDVGWDSLESGGKGQYSEWYVTKLDRFMGQASARGIKVIVTLTSTPCWASSAPESLKQGCEGEYWNRKVQLYAPSNPADYGDAARWITGRYGQKLAALEVWNEPNLNSDRFLIAPDKAVAYASILKAAYPKAKQGNAAVPVLAGALAYENDGFVKRMFAQGIQGSYDGLSIHPYNDGAPTAGAWAGLNWARGLQRAAGLDKPLWVTEFGWSTCRAGSGWCTSASAQARDTAAGFAALRNERNVKAGIVYNLRDTGNDAGDMENNFGLVRHDFSPKPAFYAMQRALRGGAPVARTAVKLRLRRKHRAVMASVSATGRQKVTISLSRCRAGRGKRLVVQTSAAGRAVRRLGSVKKVRSCKVSARAHQLGRIAVAGLHG